MTLGTGKKQCAGAPSHIKEQTKSSQKQMKKQHAGRVILNKEQILVKAKE